MTRYGVVGAGYWGENHVRVGAELQAAGLVDEVVVCDVDEARARELAARYDLSYRTDPADLAVDAATLATPSPTHHDLGVRLLERGVDLLVEKPLALSAADAWDLVETAETAGRTLAVGHIFRHHPALCELHRRVERGELGEIRYLHTDRFSFRVPRETAGVLPSVAIHDVDVYAFLLGEAPVEIDASLSSFVRDGVEETATITLEYGDATGVINASWQVPVYGKRRHLVVVGSERVAFLDYLEDTTLELYDYRVVEDDGRLQARTEGATTHHVDGTEPLKAEVIDFVHAAETGGEPRAPGRVGARAVEVIEQCRRASEDGEARAPSTSAPLEEGP